MSADIIDIRTRKKWSTERTGRAQALGAALNRADCTAPFYDLIFLDPDEEFETGDLKHAPPPR